MVTGDRRFNNPATKDSNSIWLNAKPARDFGRCKRAAVNAEVGVLAKAHGFSQAK
jgi:hypothetical protein